MFLHYLRFAFHSLARNKTLSVIKVAGLVIGVSACLVVFLIANFELSFDRFQPDRHRIYRVYTELKGTFSGLNSGAPTAWSSNIKKFSNVESACNFHTLSGTVKVPDKVGVNDFGKYDRIIITPPEYFDVFDFYEWIIGSPRLALEPPLTVVLTESRAKKYFGSLSPSEIVGREIRYNDSLVVTVSGIVKDVKERTDFDFTDFISFNSIERSWLKGNIQLDSWHSVNGSSQLFIKVTENSSALQLEQQIPTLAKIFNSTYKGSWNYLPRFQPLHDLHFNPALGIFDHSRSVPERSVLYTLIVVALLLLAISLVNYINVETAQATDRAREVGIRKTLGSSRNQLVLQFLVQGLVFIGFAVIVSPIIAWIALKNFGNLVPPGVGLDFTDPTVYVFLFCCLVLVTILASLYPAFVLSSYHPAHVINNLANLTGIGRTTNIRKGLSVFQFTFSQVLIILTIGIGVQLDYILNKDLGFSHDAVLYFLCPPGESRDKTMFLRDELNRLPEIETVSSSTPPALAGSSASIMFDNGKEMLHHNVIHLGADTAFLNLYEIELVAGRNFYAEDGS